jgi:D-tagatose-1,6-bisphosphate aldolase subunit GatZ/KbaZ
MDLLEIITAQKQGEPRGIPAYSTANATILETILQHGLATNTPVLIEATCNQVNQYGGYTGMTPVEFVEFMGRLADQVNFPQEQLFLGGDHLGPEVWQTEPATSAMEKAKVLIRDYVRAGFTKIHLDASMKLADDPAGPLSPAISADRAAELAAIAENTSKEIGDSKELCYVIGSEVPIPGGLKGEEEQLQVTTVPNLTETIAQTRAAFEARGLAGAWEQVVAVVVQPGVEFGNDFVIDYDPDGAAGLVRFIASQKLVFEAHSTDYQDRAALRQMVADQFAILKVGPALTYAYREAIFALAMMENELFPAEARSNIIDVLDAVMVADPKYWQNHYSGEALNLKFARKYSWSDRSRYYWPAAPVQTALQKLFANLQTVHIPQNLISQFLPQQYAQIRAGVLASDPLALVQDKVWTIISDYHFATQP